MATINWPTKIKVGAADYGIEYDVQITTYRNGRITTFVLPGARWVASLRFENDLSRPSVEAMLAKLKGGGNRLSMPHWGKPPRPVGTLSSSATVASPITAGAESFTMTNANGGLKEGDIIGLPGQFVMVLDDADPFATNLTANVSPPIRRAHNSGTAVTWNRPTQLWIPRTNIAGPFPYLPGKSYPPITVDFVEAWA